MIACLDSMINPLHFPSLIVSLQCRSIWLSFLYIITSFSPLVNLRNRSLTYRPHPFHAQASPHHHSFITILSHQSVEVVFLLLLDETLVLIVCRRPIERCPQPSWSSSSSCGPSNPQEYDTIHSPLLTSPVSNPQVPLCLSRISSGAYDHSQPFSLIICANSIMYLPSLYFWLLSKACS